MLARFAAAPLPAASFSESDLAAVRHCFADGLAAEAILERCAALEGDAALSAAGRPLHGAAAALRRASPTSVKVSLELLRRGAALPLEECFAMELRVTAHLLRRGAGAGDFYEGVRALLIDKDQKPRWAPAALADVAEADVAAAFAPLEQREELFPAGSARPWHCCF